MSNSRDFQAVMAQLLCVFAVSIRNGIWSDDAKSLIPAYALRLRTRSEEDVQLFAKNVLFHAFFRTIATDSRVIVDDLKAAYEFFETVDAASGII